MQHYFVPKKEDEKVFFYELDIFHIKKVMRFKNNQKVITINNGYHYVTELVIKNSSVVGNIVEKLDVNNENINKTSVFVSILKPKRFNYLIQKASELGVNDIFPIISERTVTKFNSEKEKEKKIKQWRWIAKEAAEQSERNYIPRIHSIKTIDEIIPGPSTNYLADTKLRTTMTREIQTMDETCCVFGPEGGFSPKEIEILHKKGFNSISLGKRILRSETAPVVFLSLFL